MASLVLGVAGEAIAGPIGFVVGSMLGSLLDPQRTSGPRLTDVQQQVAQDGGPIPLVWGRPQPFAGTLIWCGDLVEHKSTKTQGKGGPKVTTYTYTRSYAIGLCEGPIDRITRMWRNNTLVFDETPNASAEAKAATAKLKAKLTIYLGDEDQLPDPTMEADKGVGNVPAHRGMPYFVMKDDDVTDVQGAVPQWKVEVEAAGDYVEPSTIHAAGFSGALFPWAADGTAQTLKDPRVAGVTYEYQFNFQSGSHTGDTAPWRDSLDEAIQDARDNGIVVVEATLRGWTPSTYAFGGGGDGVAFNSPFAPWDSDVDAHQPPPSPKNTYALGLVFARVPFIDEQFAFVFGPNPTCNVSAMLGGIWSRTQSGFGSLSGGSKVFAYNAPDDWGPEHDSHGVVHTDPCAESGQVYKHYDDFIIACRPKYNCQEGIQPGWSPIPDAPGFYVDTSGAVHSIGADCAVTGGSFLTLQVADPALPGHYEVVSKFPVGPTMLASDPANTEADWTDAYDAAVAAGSMEEGLVYGVDYPVDTTQACQCPLPGPLTDGVPLSRIVGDLCLRSNLTTDDFDVAELVDTVQGDLVGSFTGASDAILPLMAGFGFDSGEWDDKLRFVMRGADSVRTLTLDDMVEQDDAAPIKTTIQQDIELPRKLTVQYFDTGTDGSPTTQSSDRNTADVRAVGEVTIQIPVVMDANHAMQRAVILHKTMWTEAAGDEGFGLPYRHSDLVPTDCITVPVDGRNTRVRIDTIENENGILTLNCKRDRQSAHFSSATGISPVTTKPVIGGLLSPTRIVPMNLGQLRSQDNSPGVYVGVSGLLAGWTGAQVLLSTDGGITYSVALTVQQATVMGFLTADQDAADTTLDVQVLSGELDNATADQVAAGVNAYAVTTAAVSEIGAFQTQTSTGANTYTLDDLTRGLKETSKVDHATGDAFVMLGNAYFVPIDKSFDGQTLYFKAVTVGASEDSADPVAFVYGLPHVINAATEGVPLVVPDGWTLWIPPNTQVPWSSDITFIGGANLRVDGAFLER